MSYRFLDTRPEGYWVTRALTIYRAAMPLWVAGQDPWDALRLAARAVDARDVPTWYHVEVDHD